MARDGLNVFDGTGRRPYGQGRRRTGRLGWLLRFVVVVGIIAGAVGAWFVLRAAITDEPARLTVLGIDGTPIVGANVSTAEDSGTTTAGGVIRLPLDPPAQITVSAPGYRTATYDVSAIPDEGPLFLQMEPRVLQGRVLDASGTGIPEVTVTAGDLSTKTGEFGGFEIVAASPGTVTAEKPSWGTAAVEWGGEAGRLDVTLEPFVVRGVRVSPPMAGGEAEFEALLDLIAGTTVNTLVFDTKSEGGQVHYRSQVPDAVANGSIISSYDPATVLARTEQEGLYTITRIVTFQDSPQGQLRRDHAVQNSDTGGIWMTNGGSVWIDPTIPESWRYPIDLGVEACELGFDEIQYDYVRFPSDGPVGAAVYSSGPVDSTARLGAISSFLDAARTEIHEAGCAMSADVFAIVFSVPDDQGLGQRPEEISAAADAISPMIYPSHYGPGWLGFDNPNDWPSEVVSQALDAGSPRVSEGSLVRPWLQAFFYDGAQVQAGIAATEERGFGWILWNVRSEYTADMFPRP